jgi:hypothetical protein
MDKVNRAAAVGIILFSIVMAGFIGARVDQTTIALLGGTFLGLLVAVPATVLVVIVALRRRNDAPAEHGPRYSAPMPHSPPQYWVMPNAQYDVRAPYAPQAAPSLATLQPPIAAPDYLLPASRRRFYVIGEAGEVREIDAPTDGGDPYGEEPMRF